jgi:hypothetical protein
VRSFFATLRTLVLPGGAGPGTGRIVLGPDVPQALQDYYFGQVTAAILFYASDGPAGFDNYWYEALFEPIAGHADIAHGWYDADNDAILEFENIRFASVGLGQSWQIGTANGTDATVQASIGNSVRAPDDTVETWTHQASMTNRFVGPTEIDTLRHLVNEQDTASTRALTTYANLTNIAGRSFVAPRSGIVTIHWQSVLNNNTVNNGAALAPWVGTGSTVGAGTEVLPASDVNATSFNVPVANQGVRFAGVKTVTGLTPGDTYNVSMRGRAVTGGTASFTQIHTTIVPSP